jgi:hypothetical protein
VRDREEAAAVWIAAAMREFWDDPLPENWRGRPFDLIGVVYKAAIGFLESRDFAVWSPSMRTALPSIIRPFGFPEFAPPVTYQHMIEIAQFHVANIRNKWSVVRVSRE